MSPKITHLKQRQAELKKQICDNLDLLMGTINRSPAMMYYGLTTKVEGKTVGPDPIITVTTAEMISVLMPKFNNYGKIIFKQKKTV